MGVTMRYERLVLVTKATSQEALLRRHQSKQIAEFFLRSRGQSSARIAAEHDAYHRARESLALGLPRDLPRVEIERSAVPNFLFRPSDLVIAIGPDGLLANVVKYLAAEQPIVGVNPNASEVQGVLMRFSPEEAVVAVTAALAGRYQKEAITLAEATTNDGQRLLAVNDFLIGRRDQISARYTIQHRRREERHSSSGVLVSTGVGSSGWLRAVATQARGLAPHVCQSPQLKPTTTGESLWDFPWDARMLTYVVREPYPSPSTQASLVLGRIFEADALTIASEMTDGGVIFSDGVPEDAIDFNAGTVVTVRVAEQKGYLLRKA